MFPWELLPPWPHTLTHTHTVIPLSWVYSTPWADVGVIRTWGILPDRGRQTMRQKVLKLTVFSDL